MAPIHGMETEPEIIYELIISIINVLGMMANVLLVITILRSKFMRTRTNLYVLNIAISDLFTLIVLMLYYIDKRLLRISYRSENYEHIQCVLTNLEISLQIITMTFVIILVTNSLYNMKCASQGILLVIIWNFMVVILYVNIQYCRGELTFVQGSVYATFIVALLLILFTKYYLRCKDKGDLTRDGTFRLNFATIFMCLCLTSWIVNIAAEFSFKHEQSIFKHFILAFGTSVKVGKNIALALYVFKFNEMFKDSLLALFNCRTLKINESVNYSTDQTSLEVSIHSEKR